jgi:hypothetical protein
MQEDLYHQYAERLSICLTDGNQTFQQAKTIAGKECAVEMRKSGLTQEQTFALGMKFLARARNEGIIK